VDGRWLDGIYFAMDFLTLQNRVNAGQMRDSENPVRSEGKKVLVIGGGDTGSDCVGTAIRQKAASVIQIEILPKPPETRNDDNPWPYWGKTLKTSTSHEEGCEREWGLSTVKFIGEENQVKGVEVETVEWIKSNGRMMPEPVAGTKRIIEAELVLLAMGFLHTETEGLIRSLGLELDERNNLKADNSCKTSHARIFAAGDAISGASLVVNAIASGRKAARSVDRYLRNL
jgi:glutamate synthase (NADPH/NADH) small chain